MKLTLTSTLLSFCVLSSPILTWSAKGHRHIAMGMELLLPDTGLAFVNASLWPDEIRRKTGWRWTAPLHYTSTDDDPPNLCTLKKSNNRADILTAIPKFYGQLLANSTNDFALGMLIHLMQDLHQPLHMSGHGRGGNEIPIRIGRRTWKLHAVWDAVMVDALYKLYGERQVLMITTDCAEREICGQIAVRTWASQSADLVCSNVYVNINATNYVSHNLPVALEQLRLATCRTAAMIVAIYEPERCNLLVEQGTTKGWISSH